MSILWVIMVYELLDCNRVLSKYEKWTQDLHVKQQSCNN